MSAPTFNEFDEIAYRYAVMMGIPSLDEAKGHLYRALGGVIIATPELLQAFNDFVAAMPKAMRIRPPRRTARHPPTRSENEGEAMSKAEATETPFSMTLIRLDVLRKQQLTIASTGLFPEHVQKIERQIQECYKELQDLYNTKKDA